MRQLMGILKSLAALLRDLLCFVLAWLLYGAGKFAGIWGGHSTTMQGISATLYHWSKTVQGWAPSLAIPNKPTTGDSQ